MLKKGVFIFFTSFILLSAVASLIYIYGCGEDESKNSYELQTEHTPKEKAFTYGILASSATITTIALLIYYLRRRNGDVYGSIEKKLLKIIIIFCKDLLIKKDEIQSQILQLFKGYNPEQTLKLFNIYYPQSNNLKLNSNSLVNTSKEAKVFLMFSLFEIASKDRLLSLHEEKLIEYIGGYKI